MGEPTPTNSPNEIQIKLSKLNTAQRKQAINYIDFLLTHENK